MSISWNIHDLQCAKQMITFFARDYLQVTLLTDFIKGSTDFSEDV